MGVTVAVSVDQLTIVLGLLNVLAEDNTGDIAVTELALRTIERLQDLIGDAGDRMAS